MLLITEDCCALWIQRLEVICKSKMNVSFPVLNEALDFEKFVTSQPLFTANVIRHTQRGWYKSGFDHGSFLFIRSCRGKFFKGRQHHIFGSHSVATGKLALRTDLSLSVSFSRVVIWERACSPSGHFRRHLLQLKHSWGASLSAYTWHALPQKFWW